MNTTALDSPPNIAPVAPCRVWVLEDHAVVRELLLEFIAGQPKLAVVGSSGTAGPFLAAVAAGQVDLVLLDLMLEDTGGLAVLEALKSLDNPPKVVVFSAVVSLETVQTALRLGVSGYVDKAASIEELSAALERVIAGQVYLSPCVSALVSRLIGTQSRNRDAETLTEREMAALAKIARGVSTKQLARELGLSEPATYKIKSTITAKLNAQTDQELTLIALRMGLISAESAPNEHAAE